MRIPVVPLLIALVLLGAVVYFVTTASAPPRSHFGAPLITRVGDIDGVETEVAIAPDGKQYATIVSGNVWLLNVGDGSKKQVTATTEPETFPSWAPDSRTLTYTRGPDTYSVDVTQLENPERMFKADATSLSWSPSGRMAFVRNRELWIANSNGLSETVVVHSDPDPDISYRAPRFSPDSGQLSYIRSLRNLKGQVWLIDVLTGQKRELISDRQSENPLDTGWIMDGKQLVYLTDRSGAYALWTVNFADNTVLTLTPTLDIKPVETIGISVWKDRIVVPRHFVHSDIQLSDGSTVVHSDNLAFDPSVSPDGKLLAYTIQTDNKLTIWTSGIHGENPVSRTEGFDPRFAASGNQLVYTHLDLNGNPDVWTIDLRNNETESITDAAEIDAQADWQPMGRTIVFESNHGGPMSIWSVPANGGQRNLLNGGGFYPRYSADGKFIVYWNNQALWRMESTGDDSRMLRSGIAEPVPAILTRNGPKYFRDPEVNGGKPIWPGFDLLPDGRFVTAPIDIRESSLWAVDLTFSPK